MGSVYLDYAATAPITPSVRGLLDFLSQVWVNPSSIYPEGKYNRKLIEDVRKRVAEEINAEPEEIIFTSGGSESNALAIKGFLEANEGYAFAPTTIEHSSVLGHYSSERGDVMIPVTPDGVIALDFVHGMKPNRRKNGRKYLFSCNMCNNEIGTYQPISELAQLAHLYGDIVHVDAVQAFGKIKIDVKAIDVDMLSISGHKIGSIRGVGVLYVKKGINLKPLIVGTQEQGLRGGTENDLAIKSLGFALDDVDYRAETAIRAKRDYLMGLLLADRRLKLNGSFEVRNSNNLNIRYCGVNLTGQQIVTILGEAGFFVSAGSACHSGDNTPSHVLKAIGLTDEQATNSIRITIGNDTRVYELEEFAHELIRIMDMYKA